ncbi:MAG: hypothetical protein HZC02_02955 [Candidatus Levybacteria bacterium]|nr:hypothetical protein [Candidatus Levybacteria bacterium]
METKPEESDQHPIPAVQSETSKHHLSSLALMVVEQFGKQSEPNHEHKITVNPFVSKVASAYEKLRNAMEYREDEVILRATIERILRRRLLLGGTAKSTAEPLIRELIWARYLPDNAVPASAIKEVEDTIDLYLQLRLRVLEKYAVKVSQMNEWTYHLMSSAVEHVLNPNNEKQTLANFMYQVMKDDISIVDDDEQTRDAQVYIAVRKAFARDDIAFLRFHLFQLYFGGLSWSSLDHVVTSFPEGFKEISAQLHYPRKDRIYSYIKHRAAVFFILEDILIKHGDSLQEVLEDEEKLKVAVWEACEKRYKSISRKVRTAIMRSFVFILLTKVLFAFGVEGTYEQIFYGSIQWTSILLNTSIPPLLMILVSVFIRTPNEENTRVIYSYVTKLLYDESPRLGSQLVIKKQTDKPHLVFSLLWLSAFLISFGSIISVLSQLHFNLVSQGIFIFFVTIVSFLAYRISMVAHVFSVGEKQGILTPLIDFLFMPVIRVGRRLTQSISQINFFLFLFDFLIETPFKVVFAAIEQWFKFLHEKTEDLG